VNKVFLSLVVFLFDLSALVFAWAGGFFLRFNFDIPANFMVVVSWGLLFLLPAHAVACRIAGLYRGIWMFASLPDLKRVLRAVGLSTAALLVFFALYRVENQVVPRSLLMLYPMLMILYMGGGRAAYRMWKEHRLIWWLDCPGQTGGDCWRRTGRGDVGARTGAQRRLAGCLSGGR
jgi:FlaA1/EpsC-like NDP-sugar epimerase